MYILKHFEETRPEVLHQLIRDYPLGTLIVAKGGEVSVDHLPFILRFDEVKGAILQAHLPRANKSWELLDNTRSAVVVFRGPDAYITPTWYPSKLPHGKAVPTWNYVAVHAHGVPQAIHDAEWLTEHLNELTNEQEKGRNPRWQMSDAPADYIKQMVRAIVGIEMPVEKLEGKWKASQNRPLADRKEVAAGLRALDHKAMARIVEG